MSVSHISLLVLLIASGGLLQAEITNNDVFNPEVEESIIEADNLLMKRLLNNNNTEGTEYPALPSVPLDDINVEVDNETYIDFTDLKLKSTSFKLTSAVPDLDLLNINVQAKTDSVVITGNYNVSDDVINQTSIDTFPSNEGQVILSYSNVAISGIVGLNLSGTHLRAHDLDLSYTSDPVILNLKFEDQDGVTQMTEEIIEETVFEQMANELKPAVRSQLNVAMQRDFNTMLDKISLPQLVGSHNNEIYFKELTNRIVNFDNFVDALLNQIKASLPGNIGIDGIWNGFKKKILWITWHGHFHAKDGYFHDVKTLHRAGEVTLNHLRNGIEFAVPIRLSTLGFNYMYEAKFMNVGPRGKLSGSVGSNSMLFRGRLQYIGDKCSIVLEEFKVREMGKINMKVTGLGIFNWILNLVANNIVNKSRGHIISMLEAKVPGELRKVLRNYDCGQFFPKPSDVISDHLVQTFN